MSTNPSCEKCDHPAYQHINSVCTFLVKNQYGNQAMCACRVPRGAILKSEILRLERELSIINDDVCQTLGKALGYPWYMDDQKNFPGADESSGVSVGDHVAGSIAREAATKIAMLETQLQVKEVLYQDAFEQKRKLEAHWFGHAQPPVDGCTYCEIETDLRR